ncbi:MAG TPA: LptF/LptG family permease [Longimicrobiales bacterium]|nr:LptF/LptG family permease [Longimicrobiales bacterium]
MEPRIAVVLARIAGRMAELSPPRHRELVRGMLAELDAISDPAERTRFALGAIGAIARLALIGVGRAIVHAPGRLATLGGPNGPAHPGGPPMSTITTRRLLGRLAVAFAVSVTGLTGLLLGRFAARWVPEWRAEGLPLADVVQALALSLPHTVALTIPMAVFLAAAWVFTRLGAEGVLASAARKRGGLRRLLAPVVVAALAVTTVTLVSNTQLLPRANARLVMVVTGSPTQGSDRTMTVGELREAAERVRVAAGPGAAARAAAYEVEVQKKLALAAACLFLALAGVATGLRFPRGGAKVVIAASTLVFAGYWTFLMAGESLADRQMLSPVLAMWAANALLLGLALFVARRPGRTGSGAEELALGG